MRNRKKILSGGGAMSSAVPSEENDARKNDPVLPANSRPLRNEAFLDVSRVGNRSQKSCGDFGLGTPEFAERCKELDRRSLGYRFVKRLFDVLFSVCVIALGFIPGLVLCALIMLDTKDSPISSQERIGRGGKTFRILKFRTMVADSDNLEKYLSRELLDEWTREHKVDGDPRITALGKILRNTSIDEFPQFINVLLNDMSVIGPRAISYEEILQFGDDAMTVLAVPQGITGAWQVGPRNEATFENGERQIAEIEYARNACLREDLRIFFTTFACMIVKRTGK